MIIIFFNIVIIFLSAILGFFIASFKFTPIVFSFATASLLYYQGILHHFTPFWFINVFLWWMIFNVAMSILFLNFTWGVSTYINTSYIFSFLYFEIFTLILDAINKKYNFVEYNFNMSKPLYFLVSIVFAIFCAYKGVEDGEYIDAPKPMKLGTALFLRITSLPIYFFGGCIFTTLYVDRFKIYTEFSESMYHYDFSKNLLTSRPMYIVYIYMLLSLIIGFIVDKYVLDIIIESDSSDKAYSLGSLISDSLKRRKEKKAKKKEYAKIDKKIAKKDAEYEKRNKQNSKQSYYANPDDFNTYNDL